MRIKDEIKIQQIIDFSIKNKIDMIMITETNSKRKIVMENIMKNKMKRLDRNIKLIVSNSKVHNIIKRDQLQGGMMNLIREKVPTLIDKENIKKDDM